MQEIFTVPWIPNLELSGSKVIKDKAAGDK